jgi:hypothetical protein
VWKLGLLRASKEVNIVAALKESLNMYAMVRVGRRNRERELLLKNWDTVCRLEHLAVTVPALSRCIAKPDDIKTEFETLFAKLLPDTLHSLLFSRWTLLEKGQYVLLAEYVSSTPTLRKLLLPPTKDEHTRGVSISTRLEYDDGTQFWTRIGADLGLAKS